ncbi:MAG: DUF6259 domain-containing protein, partial [Victivallaceae bacterium]
ENEFVKWMHDLSRGGELSAAIVKNGSNSNLLPHPQSTSAGPWIRGGWRQYAMYETIFDQAVDFNCETLNNGVIKIAFASGLKNKDGEALAGVTVLHSVEYHPSGAADHTVTLDLDIDLDLGHIRIGTLSVTNQINNLAVRPCAATGWAAELQNPCQWIRLENSKSRSDLPAYRSRFLPLSVLLMRNGVEGIEMALGDDLGAWDSIGTDAPGFQQGAVYEVPRKQLYEAVFAPLDSPRAGNIVKAGKYVFKYRLTLPYVKKNIVPLECASTFLRNDAVFEKRWPQVAELKKAKANGFDLLRLHNDGDKYSNGIFWRDTDYPPYPSAEMAKMDAALSAAKKIGISVVPYFSVKEYHPETAGFDRDGENFARMVKPGEKFMENFFGTSLFGMQMCLESSWYETRRKTIAKTLENHDFNGLYFDWCMGLECINPAHNGGRRHWDNDRLLDLMTWSRNKAGRNGRLYLHMTNVPSLAIENMGDMILTEESEYREIFPEMFTPHVHFMNIAPRSICVMLFGDDLTDKNIRRLAMAALLHHATLCTMDNGAAEFYAENRQIFDSFTTYERHYAPGEGVTETFSREVGMSLYVKGNHGLALLANFSDSTQNVEWRIKLNGRITTGTSEIAPCDFLLCKVELQE